jgi:hypothetical protein
LDGGRVSKKDLLFSFSTLTTARRLLPNIALLGFSLSGESNATLG